MVGDAHVKGLARKILLHVGRCRPNRVLLVDEFRTTKMCYTCGMKTDTTKQLRAVRPYSQHPECKPTLAPPTKTGGTVGGRRARSSPASCAG